MTDRCFYFGCWNEPGHFLYAPGGHSVRHEERRSIELYAEKAPGVRHHLDGTLAPRTHQGTGKLTCDWLMSKRDGRGALNYSEECPQGQFLYHVLPNGFTAIQWWDRNQGDKRGACNSTVLLEGVHTAAEVLAAGREHFPHVFENLQRAGVELVEVHHG